MKTDIAILVLWLDEKYYYWQIVLYNLTYLTYNLHNRIHDTLKSKPLAIHIRSNSLSIPISVDKGKPNQIHRFFDVTL